MNQQLHQIDLWLRAKENEHIEFKEAKQRYDFEELVKNIALPWLTKAAAR